MSNNIIIIGAGPAGMLAAGILREAGASVTVFEKNEKPGRKLAITGKGRCNVTNDCTEDEFFANIPVNSRFLYSAYNAFTNADVKDLFENKLGVPLKTERGNRVFPVSDRAYDIVDALKKYMGVKPKNETVTEITAQDGYVTGVKTSRSFYAADTVLLCTGGASYPLTGSTGDGYNFARKLGHTVTEIKPSLVPLTSHDRCCPDCQGLSLRNVTADVWDTKKNKSIYREMGEMLFTHFGLSGPLMLTASSRMREMEDGRYTVRIDLKPALDEKTLDSRLLSDFAKYSNRDLSNALSDLLPRKIIPSYIEKCGMDGTQKVNSITKQQRRKMLETLKCFEVTISGFRPIAEAIITSGGVSIKEISPRTMESKLISGLYFAGEIIDVDAYTGGFNLQIAFSTAAAAANAIAENIY